MTLFAQIVTVPVGVPEGRGFGLRHGVGHAAMVASSGDASTWWLIFGCVAALAYLVLGVATAVVVILADGEPSEEDAWVLGVVVAAWPLVAAIQLPLGIARWIRARGGAKPAPFEDPMS